MQPTNHSTIVGSAAKETNPNKQIKNLFYHRVLCGRQNIPLHGHRDSTMDKEKDPCVPHGNFWGQLKFTVSSGNIMLRDHLDKAPATAKYTSPDVQNQVIAVLEDHIWF